MGHPYRSPSDPGPPRRRSPLRDPGDWREVGLLAFLLLFGLLPVAPAMLRGKWSIEASMGTALALFAGRQLIFEVGRLWRGR